MRQKRLWIDAETGLILRLQQYGGADGDALISEIIFTQVAYDRDFPASLFQPQHRLVGSFYADFLGDKPANRFLPLASPQAPGHERLPEDPRPAASDLSASRLTFQYPENYSSLNPDSYAPVSLFADGQYAGSLPFVDPWNVSCDRSADGSRIVFGYRPSLWKFLTSYKPLEGLRWMDVNKLDVQLTLLPGVSVTSFAFAPTSSDLAFFGTSGWTNSRADFTPGRLPDPGYGRADQDPGAGVCLQPIMEPGRQTTRPDRAERASSPAQAMIVDVSSGQITYRAPYPDNAYNGFHALPIGESALPADWPAKDWGEFPNSSIPWSAALNPRIELDAAVLDGDILDLINVYK